MHTMTRTELPDDLLERFRLRAAELDRNNAYFEQDLADLREIGYLAAVVPAEFGGWGLSLAEFAASQRRLAAYAPATALAMTMHSYWVGIAVELERAGDTSLRWVFDAAVDGQVFAAGHAEAGNDVPVLMSTCRAERVDGGYRLAGRKQFGSNGPTWNWLGAHAIDMDAPGGPTIVHAFVERGSAGATVVETWDTLGMRPTQSHDTVLDNVFVPDSRIGRVVPAGDGSDLFVVAMGVWPLSLIAAVYLGIADRALELAAVGAQRKSSVAIERGAYAFNPFVQHQLAEMFLRREAAAATLERYVAEWTAVGRTDAQRPEHVDAHPRPVSHGLIVEQVRRVLPSAVVVSGTTRRAPGAGRGSRSTIGHPRRRRHRAGSRGPRSSRSPRRSARA